MSRVYNFSAGPSLQFPLPSYDFLLCGFESSRVPCGNTPVIQMNVGTAEQPPIFGLSPQRDVQSLSRIIPYPVVNDK